MFQKATRQQARLRLAVNGPAGSGKTFSALRIAAALLADGQRMAVIDTEHGSASLYADSANPDGGAFDFDCVEMHTMKGMFSVENYLKSINAAKAGGYPVLVIDSLSHAWAGQGGLLERVDKAAKNSRSGNSYTAWRDVTPLHNQLVDAMLAYPGHVVVTMRSKMAYVMEENDRGKKVPKKVGLQPIQRDGLEYEFTVVGDMDGTTLRIGKTRCSDLVGSVFEKPGKDVADILKGWLSQGKNWHDENWERDKGRFFAALGELGVDYDAAQAHQEQQGRLRPSQVGTEGRKALLDELKALAAAGGE